MRPLTRSLCTCTVLVLLAVSLLTPGCSSGVTYDLRGPGPMVGQVYSTEETITMTNGTMTLTAGGMTETFPCKMTILSSEVEEVLALEKGEITRARTRIIRQEEHQTVHVDGRDETNTETSPLQGETVECAKVGGQWKITLVGKTPDSKQAKELKEFPTPDQVVDYYPAGPVKLGHRWTMDASKLKKMMGSNSQFESGNCKVLFEKITDVDGELCALLTEELQLQGKAPTEGGDVARGEMKVAGSSLRSLKRWFTLNSRLTGTITFTETITVQGQKVERKISGPIVVETKTQKK